MLRGDFYIINYLDCHKEIVAMFYEEKNDVYLFKDKDHFFGVSKNAIKNKEIILSLLEP